MDTGPIIAQAAVPVVSGDSPDSLAARVLKAEHGLYPAALGMVAAGRVRCENEKITIFEDVKDESPMFPPSV
jgi:phosphoribosylglycinamide formyltransferase-1